MNDMQDSLVIGVDLTPRAGIRWQDAVCMVLAGKASVFEEHATELVRSQHLTMPLPTIVMLNRWVEIAWDARQVAGTAAAAKRAVLKRDKHRCAYCGLGGATTVDHILPQSRGGRSTWENMVACCTKCNNAKDDRTPEEWAKADPARGRLLRYQPFVPTPFAAEQDRIYKIAEQRYGATLTA